jgi:BirA family biotin operon repressor/biotin-[acetyl-CoA-carboxylase] ligase
VAEEQRTGRGRHGRQWASPPGNLYATLLLAEPCEPRLSPQLGFVAGLALHETVEAATGIGFPRLTLKWPNDLLLDGAKVAGLLLEGHRIAPGGRLAVVIGFGLNVASAPSGTPYPTIALRSVAASIEVDAVFPVLAETFSRRFAAWSAAARRDAADAFAVIRQDWLGRAAGLGTQVTLRLPSGERTGSFVGLDATGRLQLNTASGVELIDAGDLYFPDLLQAAAPTAGAVRS